MSAINPNSQQWQSQFQPRLQQQVAPMYGGGLVRRQQTATGAPFMDWQARQGQPQQEQPYQPFSLQQQEATPDPLSKNRRWMGFLAGRINANAPQAAPPRGLSTGTMTGPSSLTPQDQWDAQFKPKWRQI
jgi:hypothetical protein